MPGKWIDKNRLFHLLVKIFFAKSCTLREMMSNASARTTPLFMLGTQAVGEIMMYQPISHVSTDICVAGTGHTTGVLVPILTNLDYRVAILTRSPHKAEQLKGARFVLNDITTKETYYGEPFLVTTNAKTALQHSRVVVLAIPMSGWETYLQKILPHVQSGSTIITLQSQASLKLMVKKVHEVLGIQNQNLTLVSCDLLPFTCRSTRAHDRTVITELFSVKAFTNLVIDPGENREAILPLLHDIIPHEIIEHQRGLELLFTSSNASIHVPIMVGLYEEEQKGNLPRKFYHDITDSIVELLENLNHEHQSIVREIKKSYQDFKVPHEGDLLAYMCGKHSYLVGRLDIKTLGDFFRKNPAYQNMVVPTKEGQLDINSRTLTEDVPFTLVPFWDACQKFGIKTPVLKRMILDAQKIMGKEYITVDGQRGQDFKETPAPHNFGITTPKELMTQY